MTSSNAQCNALQAVVGLFTHSSNTVERVVEVTAHSGLSVVPMSVNRMTKAVSKEAAKDLAQQLSRMITAIAYHNPGINFWTGQLSVEYSGHLSQGQMRGVPVRLVQLRWIVCKKLKEMLKPSLC